MCIFLNSFRPTGFRSSPHFTKTEWRGGLAVGTSLKVVWGSWKRRRRTKGGGSDNRRGRGAAAQSTKKHFPFVLFFVCRWRRNFAQRSNSRRTYSDDHDAVVQESEADEGESVVQQNWRENNKQERITLAAGQTGSQRIKESLINRRSGTSESRSRKELLQRVTQGNEKLPRWNLDAWNAQGGKIHVHPVLSTVHLLHLSLAEPVRRCTSKWAAWEISPLWCPKGNCPLRLPRFCPLPNVEGPKNQKSVNCGRTTKTNALQAAANTGLSMQCRMTQITKQNSGVQLHQVEKNSDWWMSCLDCNKNDNCIYFENKKQ